MSASCSAVVGQLVRAIMSEEVTKADEVSEQTEDTSNVQPKDEEPANDAQPKDEQTSDAAEPKDDDKTGEQSEEKLGEGDAATEGEGGAQAAEGEEEPEVKEKEKPKEEKPQRSDPEEPVDDDVPIVLVTGASGFLGTHIVKQLLEQGRFRVRGTVRDIENEKKVKPVRELVAEPTYPLRLIEADLLNPKHWTEAVRRCSYVFHVASPLATSKKADEIIKPAVEGTTSLLNACAEAGSVKRVVLTSSIAAIVPLSGDPEKPKDYVFTEADWAREEICSAYEKSKLRAEKAAWDLVKNLDQSKQFELVVLCPGLFQGPLLSPAGKDGSAMVPINLLTNKKLPDIHFQLIDIRDVAKAHIAALEKPEAAGSRYVLVNERIQVKQMAQVLAAEFKPQGYKVPTKDLPKAAVWAAKFVKHAAKTMYALIGKQLTFSNDKMKGELGIEPREVKDTLIDTAYSLIELGLVPKKRGYLGHPSTRPPPEEKAEAEAPAATAEAETEGSPTKESSPEQESEAPPPQEQTSESKTQEPPSEPAKEETRSEPAKAEPPPSEPAKQEEPPSEPVKQEESPVKEDEPPSEPEKKEEPPSEPAKEEEPPSEPVKEEEPPSEPAKEEEPPSEPAKEEEPPSEPAKEEEPPSEPAKEEEPPSEPAKEEEPPSEPAKEEEPPSEPAKEEEPPSEPVKEEEPPSEPAKEEEPPSEPAKEPEQEEESPSEPPQTEDAPSEPVKEDDTPSEPTNEEPPVKEETPTEQEDPPAPAEGQDES